jgi:hypothetical protein
MKILITILLTGLFAVLANAQVVPFFDVKSGGLLGGVENGRFLDAKTTFAKVKGEGKFTLFGIKGKVGELTATVKAPDEPCDDFYYVEPGMEVKQGFAIGAGRSWNPVPRDIKAIDLNDKTYLKAVSDILRTKGMPKAKAVIEQAVRVDLDGDGVDEVLLTASSYGGTIQPRESAGNYSFVLLRKMVAGKVQNIMISEEYVKKNIDFGAPNRYEISGIVDLNGDKKMEIVVFGEYYEGNGAAVYEIKGNKPVEIKTLGAGCGV